MRYRYELLLFLLLVGLGLFTRFAHLPRWLSYAGMLLVLLGAYRLVPEWFAGGLLRWVWLAGLAVCLVGILLEAVTIAHY